MSQTSKLPRQVDSIRAESSSNLCPTAFQTSGTPRQFDFIRAELPSNGYPQPSGRLPHSAHSTPLRHIWADCVIPFGIHSQTTGSCPDRGVPPPGTRQYQCLPLLRPVVPPTLLFFFMRVRRWIPLHLPGSIPYEEGKSIYTPCSTASSGSPAVDAAGRCFCLRCPSRDRRDFHLPPLGLRSVRLVRYYDDYHFQGPLCGRTAARVLSSRCPLGTSSISRHSAVWGGISPRRRVVHVPAVRSML